MFLRSTLSFIILLLAVWLHQVDAQQHEATTTFNRLRRDLQGESIGNGKSPLSVDDKQDARTSVASTPLKRKNTSDIALLTHDEVLNSVKLEGPLLDHQKEQKPRHQLRARHLDQQSTDLVIRNDCADAAKIAVLFYTARGMHLAGYYTLDNGYTLTLAGVNNPTFYLYGTSVNYKWDGDSPFCFDTCMRPIHLESLEPEEVFYLMTCDSSGNTNPEPTPEPTPDPTPEPTPDPTPDPTPEPAGESQPGDEPLSLLWLIAHNSRRQALHRGNGVSYVPLQWSSEVAKSAQGYADKLIERPGCQISHGYMGDKYGGENIGANWGSPSTPPRSPEAVLQSWYDKEQTWGFGSNGHYTQVGWRATKYLGCGESSKVLESGWVCHIQVCRYVTPGNCNVGTDTWFEKMLADSSPCSPQCPPERCF